MTDKQHHFRDKILILLLLTFSCAIDSIVLPIIQDQSSLGIINIFLVLGVLFILQHRFKWFRRTFFYLIVFSFIYKTITTIVNFNESEVKYFLDKPLFVPSVIPLYISFSLIGMFVYYFLRNYDISR